MDFKQYEYVLTIASEKSFSKAAKKLFISQPSLSQYINRLENQMGVMLFDRSISPLKLTYEGELYIETALKIISLSEELQKKYDDITELKAGKLSIGLTPSKANDPLPDILPLFKEKYPNVELIINEAASTEIEDMIMRGKVDVGLLNLPINNHDIEYEAIYDEKILLAAPPEFSFKGEESIDGELPHISIENIKNEQFILLKPNQRVRQIANTIFAGEKIKPKILLETTSLETSLRLTASSMGFCFIPESYTTLSFSDKKPKYYTIGSVPLTWTLAVAYRKDTYHTKAAIAFAQMAKEVKNIR